MKEDKKNYKYKQSLPISKSLKNIIISKPDSIKFNSSREKYYISNFNEDYLKKYIKNQLIRKSYHQKRNNNSLSLKNSKYNENIILNRTNINKISFKNSNSSQRKLNNNLLDSSINYKKIESKQIHKKQNVIPLKQPISIKYKNQYYDYLLEPKESFNKKEKNKEKLKSNKSVNNIYRNKFIFNTKTSLTNRTNKLSNQNSKTSVSTYEKSENNLISDFHHKRNLSYQLNCNYENSMNYEKFRKLLLDKCSVLKIEIKKLKNEKNELQENINTLLSSQNENDYIDKLINEIDNYKKIAEGYKNNCDELSKEIVYLKKEIGKYIK
jgi:hypothetical protein